MNHHEFLRLDAGEHQLPDGAVSHFLDLKREHQRWQGKSVFTVEYVRWFSYNRLANIYIYSIYKYILYIKYIYIIICILYMCVLHVFQYVLKKNFNINLLYTSLQCHNIWFFIEYISKVNIHTCLFEDAAHDIRSGLYSELTGAQQPQRLNYLHRH